MPKLKISRLVIPRLSVYYRILLEREEAGEFISSDELAEASGFSAAQIRRDLAYFGQFGIPGKGYRVEDLKASIIKILGTDRRWPIALVGVGNLGSALLSYQGFRNQGFDIVCAFDKDTKKIGKEISGIVIQDMEGLKKMIKDTSIKMAILSIPAQGAQETVDILVSSGIKAILSFVPARLKIPKGVEMLSIDLSIELERLAYFLAWRYAYLQTSSRPVPAKNK